MHTAQFLMYRVIYSSLGNIYLANTPLGSMHKSQITTTITPPVTLALASPFPRFSIIQFLIAYDMYKWKGKSLVHTACAMFNSLRNSGNLEISVLLH